MTELRQVPVLQNYILEKFVLTTHNNQKINLALNYAEINLFESLFSPFVMGSVLIVDNFNFLTYGPILGGEEIELIINNVPDEQNKPPKISTTFCVLSVETRMLEKNRTQGYQIRFCSKEAIYNQQVRVSSTFIKKNYSKIANDIFDILVKEIERLSPEELKNTKDRPSKKFFPLNKVNEDSGKEPVLSIHFPNLHPTDCMMYLMGKAHVKQIGNPYFFYESFDRLFYFGSFKDHFYFDYTKEKRLDVNHISKEGNKVIVFNNNQVSLLQPSDGHTQVDFYSAIANGFPKDFDFLENTKKGVYAHRLFNYDYTEKKIMKYIYDYKRNYEKVKHIYNSKEKALMLPEGPPKFKSPEYPEEMIKTTFSHSQLFLKDVNDFYSEYTKNYRYEKLQELNSNYIHINMPGDFSMYCGKFYDLYWNSPDVTTRDELKTDPHVGGTYFCLRVKHVIRTEEFTTSLELVKDSFMEKTLQTFPGKPDNE